jgi:hypothetical protein
MLASCGQSPQGVVNEYFESLDKGEISKAYSLMSKQVIYQGGERKVKSLLMEQAKHIQKKGGLDSIAVEGEAKGEIGQFTAHLTFKDKSKKDEEVGVVKEDEGWRITFK